MDIEVRFTDQHKTVDGTERASVQPLSLDTLWFNTGTLCNLTCQNCYIESSPSNDRLVYLSAQSVATFLDEIRSEGYATRQIGFTGGEPFMNPDFLPMLALSLERGFRVLALTNAMRPMLKCAGPLEALIRQYGEQLEIRVSLDHYRAEQHEAERGARSWQPTIDGLVWLTGLGANVTVAGRTCWEESESELRQGFSRLFKTLGMTIDCQHPARLVLFPEMDETAEVPEISVDCWKLLGRKPDQMMCASSRMVIHRRGQPHPVVVACTLLPYDSRFELGTTLKQAWRRVWLNHPHCARFCVLGGGSCTAD